MITIAVIHNLLTGGARRRLSNQLSCFAEPFTEMCLESAAPITDDAIVVPFSRRSPRLMRGLRPPARYIDLLALELAWRRLSARLSELAPDAIYINPCQYLQAPPLDARILSRALYFCDEVRRVDYEPDAAASRSHLTRPAYALLYRRERSLDRRTAYGVAAIATNSQYSAREIQRAYGRESSVVRLGVAPSLLRVPLDPMEARGFLLSVGTLIPSKGHDLVVRAAALSLSRPNVTVVSSRGSPGEEQRLSDLARAVGVNLDIRVGIPDVELAGLYGSALATLYLSRREPFGLASLEAQCHGCPVIVADEGGLPETIIDGATGWICERDPAAAAALIDRLGDNAIRDRMSAAAREHGQTWTWESSALQVEDLLAALATRHSKVDTR